MATMQPAWVPTIATLLNAAVRPNQRSSPTVVGNRACPNHSRPRSVDLFSVPQVASVLTLSPPNTRKSTKELEARRFLAETTHPFFSYVVTCRNAGSVRHRREYLITA
jgi:hypothetical protein